MNAHISALISTAGMFAVLGAIFIPLERLFAIRREKVLRRDFWMDLGYNFLNGLMLSSLMAWPIALITQAALQVMPAQLLSASAALPLWVRLPLALVVGDIGAYWGHRWAHRSRLLWRFHKIHHSSTHVDWLVNTRAHPVDLVFTRICGLVPLFLSGLAQSTSAAMPALVSLLLVFWSYVVHANVRLRLGWLEYLIATPAFHHWHHTNDEHRDMNFAALFPFVDKIFGTLYLPDRFPQVYGVDEPPAPGLLAQLVDPLLPDRAPEHQR